MESKLRNNFPDVMSSGKNISPFFIKNFTNVWENLKHLKFSKFFEFSNQLDLEIFRIPFSISSFNEKKKKNSQPNTHKKFPNLIRESTPSITVPKLSRQWSSTRSDKRHATNTVESRPSIVRDYYFLIICAGRFILVIRASGNWA